MAGCNCDKETYLTSYQDLTDSTKKQHVDWSSQQIRREVAKIFRPQYRQNAESIKQELSGVKEYEGTDFTYTGAEGVRFKNGDGSMGLLEFHERQLRLTPEAYSEDQHQTSLLIDQAFRSGATEVATSYPEPGGQRDIVVMTLDRVTGKGKMRIINTVSDRTMPEMQNLVKKAFAHLSEVRPAANTFILSDTHISKEQIRQKFTMLDQQVRTVIGIAKNTVREVRYTTDSVRRFIHQSYDERLTADSKAMGESLVSHMRRIFEHKEYKKGEVPKTKKHEINLLGRLSERVKLTRPQIQEKIALSVVTLPVVHMTGAGTGLAFESLNSIVRIPKTALESAKRSGKEKLRRQNRKLEKKRVFRTNEGFKKLTKKERRIFRRKEKKFSVQNEQKRMRKKEKVLWKMLKRLVQKTEGQRVFRKIKQKERLQKMNIAKKEIRQTKKRERHHVKDLSVALVIWLFLHLAEKRNKVKVVPHEQSKKLIPKEPIPWILLAIIWHLAMIRESGMSIQNKPKKVKKKQTHNYPISIPPQGVIFAFAS